MMQCNSQYTRTKHIMNEYIIVIQTRTIIKQIDNFYVVTIYVFIEFFLLLIY